VARPRPGEDKWHPDRRSNAWWLIGVGGAFWPLHVLVALALAVYAVARENLPVLVPAAVFAVVAFFEWRRERDRRG
jgi:hypothetical protein